MSTTALLSRTPVSPRRGWLFGNFPSFTTAALGILLFSSGVMAAPPFEVTGELDVIIKENFDQGRFAHDYFLRDEDGHGWYQLEFERTPPAHWRSGQRLRARGQPQGRKFRVESYDEQLGGGGQASATSQDAAAAAGQAVDVRKAVVLMVNLTNASAGQSYSQIVGNMFTNARSVDGLYREASLGQTSFPADTDGNGQPDVFGPFAINYDNSTCNYYDWAYAAEAAAQNAGVNLSLYRHRVFVLPNTGSLPSCSWAGIANVGCGTFCRAWIAGSTGMIFTHELGHNLNMAHAGSDPGNDGTIDSVYGDYSDPMGSSSSNWYLFNAAHIDQMGWYGGVPGAITTAAASGTYDLAAVGIDPQFAGASTALKIAKPDTGDFYYLSYRQPIGSYGQVSSTYTKGVNIHRYKGSGYGYTSYITTLVNGGVFTDSTNGITVQQVSQGGNYATVQISYGCAAATPNVALSPSTLAVKPGNAASFSVAVTNQDAGGCDRTVFGLALGGKAASVNPTSLSLTAGQTSSGSVGANSALADGAYSVTVSVVDTDGVAPNHAANGQGSATLVVDGTAPSTPASVTGSSDRQGRVNLSWLASTDALSGVAGYAVYRNGALIAQVSGTGYTDTSAASGTTYSYSVTARDAAGNVSATSSAAQVTAGGGTTGKGKK